jgi:hypothetical protein
VFVFCPGCESINNCGAVPGGVQVGCEIIFAMNDQCKHLLGIAKSDQQYM